MIRIIHAALVVFGLSAATAVLAQTAAPHQAYGEFAARSVKALSESQIADLRAGRGMGLALSAELNGYPGPSHALDSADRLGLTAAQRERVKALFQTMKAETIPLGELLIRQETELDMLFASKRVSSASLEASTAAIGTTQGMLRAAHLRRHLAIMEVLTPEQVRLYGEIRGYRVSPGEPHHSRHR